MIDNAPETLEEAIEWLNNNITEEDKDRIAECDTVSSMIGLTHMSLGLWIRNNFGLWEGNDKLIEDLLSYHTDKMFDCQGDDASGIILDEFWNRLREKVSQ